MYEKKGAFRTMLKHALISYSKRYLNIQREPSEEECATMAKACVGSLCAHKILGFMPQELLQEVRSVRSTEFAIKFDFWAFSAERIAHEASGVSSDFVDPGAVCVDVVVAGVVVVATVVEGVN